MTTMTPRRAIEAINWLIDNGFAGITEQHNIIINSHNLSHLQTLANKPIGSRPPFFRIIDEPDDAAPSLR